MCVHCSIKLDMKKYEKRRVVGRGVGCCVVNPPLHLLSPFFPLLQILERLGDTLTSRMYVHVHAPAPPPHTHPPTHAHTRRTCVRGAWGWCPHTHIPAHARTRLHARAHANIQTDKWPHTATTHHGQIFPTGLNGFRSQKPSTTPNSSPAP